MYCLILQHGSSRKPKNLTNRPTISQIQKQKNKSNIDELKGKMREYLAVRGGYHFVAFEAIVCQTKVPLAWVLQPKPVEPNEIQPAFHVTISFCATHLRKFRKWSSSDYSNFLNPWESFCFFTSSNNSRVKRLGGYRRTYLYKNTYAIYFEQKSRKTNPIERYEWGWYNDPPIPQRGIREPTAGNPSRPGFFQALSSVCFPGFHFPFELTDFGVSMRQRLLRITILPFNSFLPFFVGALCHSVWWLKIHKIKCRENGKREKKSTTQQK